MPIREGLKHTYEWLKANWDNVRKSADF